MQSIARTGRKRNYPRLDPSSSPLNSVIDLALAQEDQHAIRAQHYRDLARYHDQQAAAARDVRRQAERLVWNSEPVGGAA